MFSRGCRPIYFDIRPPIPPYVLRAPPTCADYEAKLEDRNGNVPRSAVTIRVAVASCARSCAHRATASVLDCIPSRWLILSALVVFPAFVPPSAVAGADHGSTSRQGAHYPGGSLKLAASAIKRPEGGDLRRSTWSLGFRHPLRSQQGLEMQTSSRLVKPRTERRG